MKTIPFSLTAALGLALIASFPAVSRAEDGTPRPDAATEEEEASPGDAAESGPEPAAEEPEAEKQPRAEDADERPQDADQSTGMRAQEKFGRETAEIVTPWIPVLEKAREGTVRLLRDGKPVALGCAVNRDGYLVTKASEVEEKGKFMEGLEAQFPDGMVLKVKLCDTHARFDLALLKVEARGLRTVEWAEVEPAPGSYLAAATPEKLPAAVGVVSVLPRNMDETHKGFLGVSLDKGESGIFIKEVGDGTAAAEAGLLVNDIVKSINGKDVGSVTDFIQHIARQKPYDTVKILISRDKQDKEISATLRRRPDNYAAMAEDVRNVMSGHLSRNRRGYPNALQHDMVLDPSECGGPVVDLDGHVVGLNIARSGRIESIAIPSATMKSLVSKAETGKFFRPELEDLRRELKNAESLLERVRKDHERLKKQVEEAEGK